MPRTATEETLLSLQLFRLCTPQRYTHIALNIPNKPVKNRGLRSRRITARNLSISFLLPWILWRIKHEIPLNRQWKGPYRNIYLNMDYFETLLAIKFLFYHRILRNRWSFSHYSSPLSIVISLSKSMFFKKPINANEWLINEVIYRLAARSTLRTKVYYV